MYKIYMFKVLIIDFVHKTFTKNTAKNMYSLMLIQRYVGTQFKFLQSLYYLLKMLCRICTLLITL